MFRTYRFPISVGVHDPSRGQPDVRDPVTGQLLKAGTRAVRFAPPGELIELDDDAFAQAIFARFGTYDAFLERQAKLVASTTVKLR